MAKALASSLSGSAWAKALDQIEIVLNLHFVAQFVVSFSVGQTRFYVFSPSPHLNLYNWSLFKINGLWVSNWERFLNSENFCTAADLLFTFSNFPQILLLADWWKNSKLTDKLSSAQFIYNLNFL